MQSISLMLDLAIIALNLVIIAMVAKRLRK